MAIPLRRADPRNIAPTTRTFFVTSSIAEKRNLLQSDRSAPLLIDVLYHYRSNRKFLLHAFVVMPDHFHALISVDPEISIERAVQFIKGGFAFRAGKELGFRAPVWQRGFSEVRIYDSEHLMRVLDYIADNPVRRGLPRIFSEFPFSSSYPGFDLDDPPQGLKRHSALRPLRHG
jgi:putative transposase